MTRWNDMDLAEAMSRNPALRLNQDSAFKGSVPRQRSRQPYPSETVEAPARGGKAANSAPLQQGQRPWTPEDVEFLRMHYPDRGKSYCMSELKRGEGSIRWMASQLKLKLNTASPFYKEFQRRAASTKVGRKRPAQAEVIRRSHAEGKLKKTESQKAAIGARTKERIRTKGHPRGALGMKHSATALAVMSQKSQAIWDGRSLEERAAHTEKSMKARIANGTSIQERPNASWKAGWRTIGGTAKYYRSRWEANYARYLEWLKCAGQIKNWAHEPKTFWFDQVKRGCRSYLPDFLVIENDEREVYHEVKGWMDARSLTKIKRMAKYFPDVRLTVIDSKHYRALDKQLKRLIPEWE